LLFRNTTAAAGVGLNSVRLLGPGPSRGLDPSLRVSPQGRGFSPARNALSPRALDSRVEVPSPEPHAAPGKQMMEKYMAKRLSQQLADLSVRAKNAEDAVAAAEKEARGKIETQKEQARTAAVKATEKVKQDIKSVGDTAVKNWTAIRTKIAADIDALKAGAAHAKHDLDARQAEHLAEKLEWEAGVAIDYAVASIEQAKLAVLDAVSSRAEAERAKAS
jgi:vacuolar-type H+-ATPase subunit I/STV1